MARTVSSTQSLRTLLAWTESGIARYLREVEKTPLLNIHEERTLARRIQEGDSAARDHLVRANLRLVVYLARSFLAPGRSLPDLIAEGNLGLLRAVESFDPARGTRFSTYASHWIKQAMRRSIHHGGWPIRLPSYLHALLGQWHRATLRLQEKIGRAPVEEEVARCLNLSQKKFLLLRQALGVVNAGFRCQREEAATFLHERLLDPRASSPESELVQVEQRQRLLAGLQRLDPREAAVLRRRFGLEGYAPMTLSAIGVQLGVTCERVRQIEKAALSNLREILQAN